MKFKLYSSTLLVLFLSFFSLGAHADESAAPAETGADASSDSAVSTETSAELSDEEETDESLTDSSDKPDWRTAASPQQQNEARALFGQGNQLVRDSLFVQAIEKYNEALSHWNHPGIHYNMALALLNLDKPLMLRDHLVASLAFGDEAIGADKARRARQYIRLVEAQLTEVVVRCEHQGALVYLDGKKVFTAPGAYSAFVRPGTHSLKVTADGFEPTARQYSMVPGEKKEISMRLYSPEDWLRYERRWEAWGPIATTISGAAMLAAGGVFYGVGVAQVKSFDKAAGECPANGCAPGEIDKNPKTGEAFQTAGVVTMIAGGATLISGGILLYLNRPIPYRVDPEEVAEEEHALNLTPVVAPGFFGLIGKGTF